METPERKRLLVIRLSALGDVAMTLPAIYSVAEAYTHLDITVLTRPFFSRLFINRPHNVSVMVADTKGTHRGVRGLFKLIRRLRAERFDYVADLHNVLRSWIIDRALRLGGSRVVMVDKYRAARKDLLKHVIPSQTPFIRRYCEVFEALGFPNEPTFKSLYTEKPEAPIVVPAKAVGIAPFARYSNKEYPLSLMHQVVNGLAKKGIPVLLFGGGGKEALQLDTWARETKGVTSVAGKYALDKELGIMSHLAVMVSMDSANQHLASLVGTPVVTIWGSTSPACGFMPYGQPDESSMCAGLDCQPCTIAGSEGCRHADLRCLTSITPDQVIAKVLKAIE